MPRPDVYLATCEELPGGDAGTALLARSLRTRGIRTTIAVWSDLSVDWESSPFTVIRSTWDYHLRRDQFLRWVRALPRVHNPPALVEWNTDKRYIFDLPRSVPVIPSRLLEDPSPDQVEVALEAAGWPEGVLKPAVGLDGHGVERVARGGVEVRPREGAWILQPFVVEVRESGEVSMVLIQGRPTHAVRRIPPAHDFRAQERLGGVVERFEFPQELATLATSVVAGLGQAPLYARVDLVEHRGIPRLMELELVEPSLFFEFGPQGLDSMVEAIGALVEGDG